MIKVLVNTDKDDLYIEHFQCKGHSDYAEKGKDLICSGVSCVVVGGLNALVDNEKYNIQIDDGFVEVDFNKSISTYDQVVMETVIEQLKTIENSFSDYIKIEIKKGN